jgi:hypothetical protein
MVSRFLGSREEKGARQSLKAPPPPCLRTLAAIASPLYRVPEVAQDERGGKGDQAGENRLKGFP